MMTVLMPLLGAAAVLSVTSALLWRLEKRHAQRTTCRCCRCAIQPGGHPVAQLGMGFCLSCATQVMRRVRQ